MGRAHSISGTAAEYAGLLDVQDSLRCAELIGGICRIETERTIMPKIPTPKFPDLYDALLKGSSFTAIRESVPNSWAVGKDYLAYAIDLLTSKTRYIAGLGFIRNNSSDTRHPTLVVYAPLCKSLADQAKNGFVMILVNIPDIPSTFGAAQGASFQQGGVIFGNDD